MKGHVSCTNHGATFGKATVSHNSESYNVDAVTIADKSQYVACKFNDIKASSDMQMLVSKGFCIETFYVDRNPSSGVHGVVCGTNAGGWGVAIRATGKPYFIVGDGAYNKYINIDAKSPASLSELTHVLAVYDYSAKRIRLYINGVYDGSATITGPFIPASGNTFNWFCLGDDIKTEGAGGDFPADDMTIVSARIYLGTMDDARVKSVYDAAVKALQ